MAQPPVIRVHPDYNVVIARATLLPGAPVDEGVTAAERIPAGRKVAVRPPPPTNQCDVMGRSSGSPPPRSSPGGMSMCKNTRMGDFAKGYAYGVNARPTDYANDPAMFEGIRLPDGKVATRNYIGILTSVNCSAHVAG